MADASEKNLSRSVRRVFAADLGGTHLRAATVSEDGRIHFRHKQKTPRERAEDIVGALVEAACECEKQESADGGRIEIVSVVVPATLKIETGVILKAPNLPCLDGFHLAAALTDALKRPTILENDANAAAVGEMWQGAGRGHRTIICVTLGTGVGGGIILDGRLWRGVNGSAAEIGHMGVDPFGGVPCTCGSEGCLEVYASATAIVRMAREGLAGHPESVLQSAEDLTSEKIYCAGVAGDALALEVFRRMGTYLGVGLASLINLLNPEMIVIGGGVVNGWNLFEKPMIHEVNARAFPIPAAQVKIVAAECGDDAGLLGAAHLGFSANCRLSDKA